VLGAGIDTEGVNLAFKNAFIAGCNPDEATTTPTPVPTADTGGNGDNTEKSSGIFSVQTNRLLIIISLVLAFTNFKR
jgi:hypothetical protein